MKYNPYEKIAAYIEITRPWWIIVLLPVMIGPAFIASDGDLPVLKILPAVLSFIFFKCSATVFNDFFDRDLDKIIHGNRPIPSGRMSEREAIILGVLLIIFGFVCAVLVNLSFLIVSSFSILLYIIYIWKIKKTALFPGVATIGTNFSISLIVLMGWTAVSSINFISLYLTLLVFLWDVSHDTTSAIRDFHGDKSKELISFAVAFGNKNAARIATIVFFIVLGMSILLSIMINMSYLSYIILIIGSITLFYLIHLVEDSSLNNATAAHKVLSLYMLVFFVSIISTCKLPFFPYHGSMIS